MYQGKNYQNLTKVDPFEVPPIELLYDAYAELRTQHGRVQFSRMASVAAEIALHPDASRSMRNRQGQTVDRLLMAQSIDGRYIAAGSLTEPLRTHSNVFVRQTFPWYKNGLAYSFAHNIPRVLQEPAYSNGLSEGVGYELAVSMAVNGLARYGVRSYPAFLRQNTDRYGAGRGIARKSWDIMLESEGTIIPRGRYPIEIKATGNTKTGAPYHPLITKVKGDYLLATQGDSKKELSRFVLRSVHVHPTAQLKTLLTTDDVAERLFGYLRKTDPIDEHTLLPPVNGLPK